MRHVALVLLLATAALGQNSTAKVRPAPSATAARAGSAVAWRKSLEEALEESQQSGKPVFWYVPTVAGSPMDRKPEIDRYMMAGPFAWPDVVALLNAHTIPVREVARGKVQKEHGLLRGKFIEPGFVILDGAGKEIAREHELTTLYPQWFVARLEQALGKKAPSRALPELLGKAWAAYGNGDLGAAEQLLTSGAASLEAPAQAEARYLLGCVYDRTLRSTSAREVWSAVAERYPDAPFGWKAAAEAEGHGPFARGFEDYRVLPARALQGGEGTRAAAGCYDEAAVRVASVRFLLAMQRQDGSYTDSRYDFGGSDGLPNVYTAGTALAGLALLEESRRPDTARKDDVAASLTRIRARIAEQEAVNLEDKDEVLWAHVYRIELLCAWMAVHAEDAAAKPLVQELVDRIAALQPQDGAWFHEYQNPFATASTLIALSHAKAAGAQVPAANVERGVRALLQCRAENGAFTYGWSRSGKPRAAVPGAAGRMPLCELALALWGKSDADLLEKALRAAFEHHDQLESVRKYDDHASALGYGGFFFWYDMYGRTEAILQLPAGKARSELVARQRQIVLSIPEIDGCFVDSHELGRSYGTAMALLCLARMAAQ